MPAARRALVHARAAAVARPVRAFGVGQEADGRAARAARPRGRRRRCDPRASDESLRAARARGPRSRRDPGAEMRKPSHAAAAQRRAACAPFARRPRRRDARPRGAPARRGSRAREAGGRGEPARRVGAPRARDAWPRAPPVPDARPRELTERRTRGRELAVGALRLGMPRKQRRPAPRAPSAPSSTRRWRVCRSSPPDAAVASRAWHPGAPRTRGAHCRR